MSVVLYSYWRSSTSYRVRIALNISNVSYKYIPINLLTNEHKQNNEYNQLNKQGIVPTLVHKQGSKDIVLSQSLSIIEYINDVFCNNNDKILPIDPVERAHARQIAYIISCDTSPLCNMSVLKQIESISNSNTKNEWINQYIYNGLYNVEQYVQQYGSNNKYCVGNSISIADICLIPQIYNAYRFNVDISKLTSIMNIYNHCMTLKVFIDASPEKQIDCTIKQT